ncbi:MAG TPA: hypothetical protein VE685_20040 [Thermoanaerobaculia bacterium]|nr:hypothetical protein [Thermoanaerobaculia bacterium]
MPRNQPPTQVFPDPDGTLSSSTAPVLESTDAPISASPALDEETDSESNNLSLEGR